MKYEKNRAKTLIELGDYPFSVEENEKLYEKYKAIVEYAVEKVGDAFTEEQKAGAKEKYLKQAENAKTKLQYVNAFLTLIERLKREKLLSKAEEQTLLENVAKSFNSNVQELEEVYAYTQGLQIVAGNETIKQNHQTAMHALINLAKLLNKSGISYHIIGALPCYLIAEGELLRYHDDIDIVVDDKDIDKITELAKSSPELRDFIISDERMQSQSILEGFDEQGKPICHNSNPHQVLFQHKDSEFHIGFFQYDQLENGERAMKRYYTDKETGELVIYHPYTLNPEEWQAEYGATMELKDENGEVVEIPCSTVKSVYDKKDTERPKDQFDRQLLDEYVKKNNNEQTEPAGIKK